MNIFQKNLPLEWQIELQNHLNYDDLDTLSTNLMNEYSSHVIYPPLNKLFTAFHLTSPENLKLVIIGQDPYHQPGQAHGLAFSVENDIKLPPSLRNIYKEIESEFNVTLNKNGNLTILAQQGVLLINSVMSVRDSLPGSHSKLGWEKFIEPVFTYINRLSKPICVLLWGNSAKQYSHLFNNPKHLVLHAAHPSPLSANRGFFGCNHFKLSNEFFVKNGIDPIDYTTL